MEKAKVSATPSPRYNELVALYAELHEKGDADNNKTPQKTFSGISLISHVVQIYNLIRETQSASLLDYGCGKALLYKLRPFRLGPSHEFPSLQHFWNVPEIQLFDPAYLPYSAKPTGSFDGVICTDVLEHCPREDIEWIVGELFSYARKFVFATVACYPANKTLPNGENAHCTVEPVEWWRELIQKNATLHPHVKIMFVISHKVVENGEDKILETVFQG